MPPRLEQERQVPPSEPVSLDRTLGRRDRDLEHLPTADHSHGCGLADRVGSERHLRSEEHTSELQSRPHLVCRLLLEKKKKKQQIFHVNTKNNSKQIQI